MLTTEEFQALLPEPERNKLSDPESTKSSMVLNEKERLELREVLRLSIGDHVSKFSEEDLDDLGMTFLELTAIALKAMHSEKSAALKRI